MGVSLLAIYFIVRQVDAARVGEALATARYIYLLPTVLLLLLGMWTRAQRWRVLLEGALPLGRAFWISSIAYLVNGLLPLRMGEVARVALANRASPPVPVMRSASSIVVERWLDLLAVVMLLVLAIASNPALPSEYRGTAAFMLPLLALGFGLLIALVQMRARVHLILARLSVRLPLLQKLDVARWLDHFLDGLRPSDSAPTAGLGAVVDRSELGNFRRSRVYTHVCLLRYGQLVGDSALYRGGGLCDCRASGAGQYRHL